MKRPMKPMKPSMTPMPPAPLHTQQQSQSLGGAPGVTDHQTQMMGFASGGAVCHDAYVCGGKVK